MIPSLLQPVAIPVLQKRRAADALPVGALFYDNFNGVNDTTLASRVPPIGNSWTVPQGAVVTNGGKAEARFTAAGTALGVTNTASGDADIRCRITIPAVGTVQLAGILFRYTGNQNYWSTVANAVDNVFRILEITSNVSTVRAELAFDFAAGGTYDMRLVLVGDLMFSTVDGIGTISHESSVRNTETRHGFRAQAQQGSGAVALFENFMILPPPPVADVTITVAPTIKIVSAYETSVVHTENEEVMYGHSTALARAWTNLDGKIKHHHLYTVSGGLTQIWPASGGTRPALSSEPSNWTSIDRLMQIITGFGPLANVPGIGGVPCLTDQTYHGWMKGVVDSSGVTTPSAITDAASFTETGRIMTAYFDHHKKLWRRMLERYMPAYHATNAPHGVGLRNFCLGIEFHGWFENAISGGSNTYGGTVASDYAWHDYPGTAGLNADMGYAYYHNEMGALIHQVATELGIDTEEIVIINNYPRMLHRTVPDSDSVATDHPLYDTVWGTADKRPLRCLSEGLELINPLYLQAVGYDLGVKNVDQATNGDATDDVTNLQKLYDYPVHIRDEILANLSTPLDHLPLIQREFYPRWQTDEEDTEDSARYAMYAAESLRLLVEAGVWQGSHWGFRGRAMGAANSEETEGAAMITSIATSDGGVGLPVLEVVNIFNDHFSAGANIHNLTITGSGVSAIAEDDVICLINKTGQEQIVSVDNATYSLAADEVLLASR